MIATILLNRLCEAEKWSSLQANLPPGLANSVRALGRVMVKDHELGVDGRELEPHVTVKYGFEAKELTAEMRTVIERTSPFVCRLGELQAFSNEQDVLYVVVESEPLRGLNQRVCTFKNHDIFPVYRPHVCVAYLKAGLAEPKLGQCPLTGMSWTISSVVFSSSDGSKETVQLRGRPGGVRSQRPGVAVSAGRAGPDLG